MAKYLLEAGVANCIEHASDLMTYDEMSARSDLRDDLSEEAVEILDMFISGHEHIAAKDGALKYGRKLLALVTPASSRV